MRKKTRKPCSPKSVHHTVSLNPSPQPHRPGLTSLACLSSARALFFSILASLPVAFGNSSSSTWGKDEMLAVKETRTLCTLKCVPAVKYHFVVFPEFSPLYPESVSLHLSPLFLHKGVTGPARPLHAGPMMSSLHHCSTKGI